MRNKWLVRCAAIALVVVLLAGFAMIAQGATSNDPMVSLSYLNGSFKSEVLTAVNSYADSLSSSLGQTLQSQANAFAGKLNEKNPQNAVATEYRTVSLKEGQTYSVPANAQLLFLSGSATVDSAVLSDTTSGAALAKNGALTANHLYVASSDCVLTASATAKFLIK